MLKTSAAKTTLEEKETEIPLPAANGKMTLEEKMKRSMAGDQRIYAELLKEIASMVRGYMYRKIPTQEDLEDVTQEVLSSIHRARKTYDGSRPLKPWIMAIATYRLNDYLRQRYRVAGKEVIDYDAVQNQISEDVTPSGLNNELLEKALKSLPDRQRDIVTMMKVDGYSAKEIAKRMDMSVSAVKVAAHRAYKKLKEQLEGQEI